LSSGPISPIIAFSPELLAFLHPCDDFKALAMMYTYEVRQSLFFHPTLGSLEWFLISQNTPSIQKHPLRYANRSLAVLKAWQGLFLHTRNGNGMMGQVGAIF
jgi:hypothetical protein